MISMSIILKVCIIFPKDFNGRCVYVLSKLRHNYSTIYTNLKSSFHLKVHVCVYVCVCMCVCTMCVCVCVSRVCVCVGWKGQTC